MRLAGHRLVLATDWAGEIEVDWDRVASLTTAAPLRLVLADGRTLTARAVPAPPHPGDDVAPGPALYLLREDGEGTAVAEPTRVVLAEIVAINPKQAPAIAWSGNVSASLVATSGNTDTETGYLEGELRVKTEAHRYGVGASFKESKDEAETTSSRTSTFLGYERALSDRWYLDASATFAEDEFQDLDLRSTLGVSAGYEVFDTETTALSTELGVAYVDESFIVSPDDDYAAGRWAVDLSQRLSAERGIELFHGHQLLVGFEDAEDQLLHTKSGVRFQLFDKLVAALQYNLDWDKSPAAGTVSTDRSLLLNLGLEW